MILKQFFFLDLFLREKTVIEHVRFFQICKRLKREGLSISFNSYKILLLVSEFIQ